ncbi:MAG: hypothetical protein ABI317_07600 [Gaiellales bacterium]
MTAAPDPDVTVEALRLAELGDARGVRLRVVGGVAVALHTKGEVHPALRRPYRDIDLVTTRKGDRDALKVLLDAGYESNARFNSMVGVHNRLVMYDTANGRQLDVFVGEFKMCHAVPFDRLDVDGPTVPLAELLVTKLQIVTLNDKDVQDIVAIVLEHPVDSGDADTVNAARVAQLLASDWGLWRTSQGSVETVRQALERLALAADERDLVSARLDALWERVEQEPKPLRFRTRARVGDRTRWYEEPDEVEHRSLGDA